MPRVVRVTVNHAVGIHRARFLRLRKKGKHAASQFLLPAVQNTNQGNGLIQREFPVPDRRHPPGSRSGINPVNLPFPTNPGFRSFRSACKIPPHRIQRLHSPDHIRTATPGGRGGNATPDGKIFFHIQGRFQNGFRKMFSQSLQGNILRAQRSQSGPERLFHQMQVQAGMFRIRTPGIQLGELLKRPGQFPHAAFRQPLHPAYGTARVSVQRGQGTHQSLFHVIRNGKQQPSGHQAVRVPLHHGEADLPSGRIPGTLRPYAFIHTNRLSEHSHKLGSVRILPQRFLQQSGPAHQFLKRFRNPVRHCGPVTRPGSHRFRYGVMIQMGKKILLGQLGQLFNQFRFPWELPAARHTFQMFQHLPSAFRGKLIRAHQPVPYDFRLVFDQSQGIGRIMKPQPVHYQPLG